MFLNSLTDAVDLDALVGGDDDAAHASQLPDLDQVLPVRIHLDDHVGGPVFELRRVQQVLGRERGVRAEGRLVFDPEGGGPGLGNAGVL